MQYNQAPRQVQQMQANITINSLHRQSEAFTAKLIEVPTVATAVCTTLISDVQGFNFKETRLGIKQTDQRAIHLKTKLSYSLRKLSLFFLHSSSPFLPKKVSDISHSLSVNSSSYSQSSAVLLTILTSKAAASNLLLSSCIT